MMNTALYVFEYAVSEVLQYCVYAALYVFHYAALYALWDCVYAVLCVFQCCYYTLTYNLHH